jgi:hypothetical protein
MASSAVHCSTAPISTGESTFRGQKAQVKAASKSRPSKSYRFRLHHGNATHRRPYKPDIAFIFVVTTCTDRFYLVSAEKAKELKLVGEGARGSIRLPHPNRCYPNHPYYPYLYPRRA